MADDAAIWQALLRAKGLTVAELAERLRTTRQHAHRLVTGRRKTATRRDDIDRALALGEGGQGRPVYALGVLTPDGEIELIPAGDAQPLFADRGVAERTGTRLGAASGVDVWVVPTWPEYAWRRLVAFHAAWGSTAEPRMLFLVDDPEAEVSADALLEELLRGFAETLRLRAAADDPGCLREVSTLGERL